MESKCPHIGLLKRAEEFANAATIVVNARVAYELIKTPIAVCYLCGHAIELALKSVLKLHGASDKDLKQKTGHNLVLALKEATSHPQKRLFSTELNEAVDQHSNPMSALVPFSALFVFLQTRDAMLNHNQDLQLTGLPR